MVDEAKLLGLIPAHDSTHREMRIMERLGGHRRIVELLHWSMHAYAPSHLHIKSNLRSTGFMEPAMTVKIQSSQQLVVDVPSCSAARVQGAAQQSPNCTASARGLSSIGTRSVLPQRAAPELSSPRERAREGLINGDSRSVWQVRASAG